MSRRVLADALAVLGSFLVLGVVCGVLWWLLVDPAVYTKARGGVAMGELELAKRFGVDGWYAVIAIVGGFAAGVVLTWWRTRDFRVTTVLLLPGAALAALVMAWVGGQLGPEAPQGVADTLRRGDTVPAELAVSAFQAYLLWPIAVLAGALMVLWSSPGVPPLPRPHRGSADQDQGAAPDRERASG